VLRGYSRDPQVAGRDRRSLPPQLSVQTREVEGGGYARFDTPQELRLLGQITPSCGY
jgi:hypothetical protein